MIIQSQHNNGDQVVADDDGSECTSFKQDLAVKDANLLPVSKKKTEDACNRMQDIGREQRTDSTYIFWHCNP